MLCHLLPKLYSRNAPGTLSAGCLLILSTSFSVTNTRGKQPATRRGTWTLRALESPVPGKNPGRTGAAQSPLGHVPNDPRLPARLHLLETPHLSIAQHWGPNL